MVSLLHDDADLRRRAWDAAAKVVAPFAVRTPLLSPPVLSERVGAKVYLKPELLQRTGSFKFRGAFNKLSSIPQTARRGGVVAFSSGNIATCCWWNVRTAISPRP